MKLKEYVELFQQKGFKLNRARVKACQELFMLKLCQSKYKESLTFKGGIIMYQLTKEIRRSTEDIDVDAMKMSITNENLMKVFNDIGQIDKNLKIQFKVDDKKISNLNHETYDGKRLILIFSDETKYTLKLKVDIGVHRYQHMKQDTLLFDMISTDESIELFVNSVEQMIIEKTSTFIKFGVLSTRIKDLLDVFYLISNHTYSKSKIIAFIESCFIISKQVFSLIDYVERMLDLLESEILLDNLSKSENWLDEDVIFIVEKLKKFFKSLLV